MFGGASSLYPYSPSSDSANSDQTSDNTPSAEPSNPDADKLNFMLERWGYQSLMGELTRPGSTTFD